MKGLSKKVFVLAGNGSYANRGCEAIVRGTTTLIRENVSECRFISNYFPRGGGDARSETDPAIIHRPFPKRGIFYRFFPQQYESKVLETFRHSLQGADAALMLGGDNYTIGPTRNTNIHLELLTVAREEGVPVSIWGGVNWSFRA